MNNNIEDMWKPNWRFRLYAEIRKRGYRNLYDFLRDYPSLTYIKLADKLGNFCAIQIEFIQIEETLENKQEKILAMDTLVRIINARLKRGWGVGFHHKYNEAGVYADWMTIFKLNSNFIHLLDKVEQIWLSLKNKPPHKGWLPISVEDAIIQEIFADWSD